MKGKFLNWMLSITDDNNFIIVIDGKVFGNSYDKKDIPMTHIVTAFVQDYNMVFVNKE